ncbi:hypothetical protein DB346_01450 [Verrucomicrobia bacterium LW23]|nr:hypothetical protein DB346_01450 [Verrucomicrobia bacterium LW23]
MSDFLFQDNVDTELFPFFVEEAQEIIKTIETALHTWHSNKGDVGSIRTLRRSFHTLKGAGNSIGHFRIGRVSGAMKTLLESVEPQRIEALQPQVTKISLTVVELIKKLLLDVPAIPHLPTARPVDVEPIILQIESLQKTASQLAA